jgi:hypothetical protein
MCVSGVAKENGNVVFAPAALEGTCRIAPQEANFRGKCGNGKCGNREFHTFRSEILALHTRSFPPIFPVCPRSGGCGGCGGANDTTDVRDSPHLHEEVGRLAAQALPVSEALDERLRRGLG